MRLSQFEILVADRLASNDDWDDDACASAQLLLGKMLVELRERRAADLSEEEREALTALRSSMGVQDGVLYYELKVDSPAVIRALAALDRLLGKETTR